MFISREEKAEINTKLHNNARDLFDLKDVTRCISRGLHDMEVIAYVGHFAECIPNSELPVRITFQCLNCGYKYSVHAGDLTADEKKKAEDAFKFMKKDMKNVK